jgi:hypothetical protein
VIEPSRELQKKYQHRLFYHIVLSLCICYSIHNFVGHILSLHPETMGLKAVSLSKKNSRMEYVSAKSRHGKLSSNFGSIIAIPAIGANPETTWRFPHDHSRAPVYLWSEVKNINIYLYSFDRPADEKEYGITRYAVDLLKALEANKEIGKRAIHFAAHRSVRDIQLFEMG